MNPFMMQRITPLVKEGEDMNMKMLSPKRQFQFSRPKEEGEGNLKGKEKGKGNMTAGKKDLKEEEEISYCSKDPYWQKREVYTKKKLNEIKKAMREKERAEMRDRPLLSHNSQLIANKLRSVSVNKSRIEQMNSVRNEQKKIFMKNKPKLIQKKTVDSLYQRKLNEINIAKESNEQPIKSLLANECDNDYENNEGIAIGKENQHALLSQSMIQKNKSAKSNARVIIPYKTITNNSVEIPIQHDNNQLHQSQRENDNNNNNNSLTLIRNQLNDYYNNKSSQNQPQSHRLTTEQHPRYPHPNQSPYIIQQHHQQQYQQLHEPYNHPSLSYIDNYHRNNTSDNINNPNNNINATEHIENQVVHNMNMQSSTVLKESNPIMKYREENNRRLQDLENLRRFSSTMRQGACSNEMSSYNHHMKQLQEEHFDKKQKEQLKSNLIQNEYSKQALDIDYYNEKLKRNEKEKEFIVIQMNQKEIDVNQQQENKEYTYDNKGLAYSYCLGNSEPNNGMSLLNEFEFRRKKY